MSSKVFGAESAMNRGSSGDTSTPFGKAVELKLLSRSLDQKYGIGHIIFGIVVMLVEIKRFFAFEPSEKGRFG